MNVDRMNTKDIRGSLNKVSFYIRFELMKSVAILHEIFLIHFSLGVNKNHLFSIAKKFWRVIYVHTIAKYKWSTEKYKLLQIFQVLPFFKTVQCS